MKRIRVVTFVRRIVLFFIAPLLLIAIVGIKMWKDKGRGLPSSFRQQAKKLYGWAKAMKRMGKSSPRPFTPERADEPFLIYTDGLRNGWVDWSWATHDLRSTKEVHEGKVALAMQPERFKGIYLHGDPTDTLGYGAIELFVFTKDSAPAGALTITAASAGSNSFVKQVPFPALSPGWNYVRFSLSAMEVYDSSISGFAIQDGGKGITGELYFDSIFLLPDTALPLAPTAATVAVQIDPATESHPISPLIYGVAHVGSADIKDWHVSTDRWGGNPNSRYNWKTNTWNSARDWEFRNYGSGQKEPKPGEVADGFIRGNKAAGVATVLTIPSIGWVSKDDNKENRSQNVPATGGPALPHSDGAIDGYDPRENRARTSVRSVARAKDAKPGEVAQDDWIRHLVATHGTAAHGGVPIYAIDNEPDLWSNTHTDIHPQQMGYDDIAANFLEYATAIKDVDPSAQVTGPVSWGWTGYQYSALDRGDDNYHTHADRLAHGDIPFLPWFLQTVRKHDQAAGRRTLDILDIHYYPQGSGLYSPQADPPTRARRLRATRSLWDPTYNDESWIDEPIRLIPRLHEWIDANYPGTKIGITEWNFGADGDISGALAILDTLCIFGRENVYLANYWTAPAKGSLGFLAFQLLRNADGNGHGFGDMSCTARSSNSSQLSSYAATDTKTGELTIVLVNTMHKATITAPVSIKSEEYDAIPRMYRLAEGDTALRLEVAPAVKRGQFTVSVPAYSAVLVRIPKKEKQ